MKITKLYSGDVRLSFFQSVAYYLHALCESLAGVLDRAVCSRSLENPVEEWQTNPPLELMSPFRFWTEWGLKKEINRVFPNRPFRVLDLGCGSGGYADFFKSPPVPCEYVGIDHKPHDSWSHSRSHNPSGMSVALFDEDVHDLKKVKGQFDLWMSSTALEHFEDEILVLKSLSQFLKKDAIGIHVVPAHHSWLIYFKHGYRRYSPGNLQKVFVAANHEILACEGLGGPFGYLLHFLFITLPERVLRRGSIKNRKLLSLYKRLLGHCVVWDWKLPPLFCIGYLVVVRYKGALPQTGPARSEALVSI